MLWRLKIASDLLNTYWYTLSKEPNVIIIAQLIQNREPSGHALLDLVYSSTRKALSMELGTSRAFRQATVLVLTIGGCAGVCVGLTGYARDEQIPWAELALRRRGRLLLGPLADHDGPLYGAGKVRQSRHADLQHVLLRSGEERLGVGLPAAYWCLRGWNNGYASSAHL